MSSKRPLVLTGILLALLIGYLCRSFYLPQVISYFTPQVTGYTGHPWRPPLPQRPAPLPGKSTVSNLKVRQDKGGLWIADFDYYYTGEPPSAELRIDLLPHVGPALLPGATDGQETVVSGPPERGRHHVSAILVYPGGALSTSQVEAKLLDELGGEKLVASQQINAAIDWPDYQQWVRHQQMAYSSPQDNFKRAVAMIDSQDEEQLHQARAIIEQLIAQDPNFDEGYVELARVAMKSNWGPDGLHQAEGLLASALQLRPDNTHARILLGYVYAHQNRLARAEALFAEVAKSDTSNPWLWTNWGELREIERKLDQAMVKYREAIALPMKHDRTDRGRELAYVNLIDILKDRKDLDGMEALYKQRIAEFGRGSCYASPYARFKLQVRGDTQGAIDLARGALNQDCEDSQARQILGLAEYVKWAGATGPERDAALNEARIFLPAGPTQLYLLAKSERTVGTAKKLLAAGEQIDQADSAKLTALAYALQEDDVAAAKRLLTLGARPDRPVGYDDVPVALIPVLDGNIEAVRMLQRSGVDYSKLRFHGVTAIEIARQSGNRKLLGVLTQQGTAL